MDIRRKQRAAVDALLDVKGRDVVVYNVAHLSPIFERVIIATGDSTRQVRALADRVEERLRGMGEAPRGVEGGPEAEWILLDFGDVVVHVMHPRARAYYNLEELWGGKTVRLRRPAAAHGKARARRARR